MAAYESDKLARDLEVDDLETLEAGASAMGLSLTADQRHQLVRFASLLRRSNRAFNLISRQDIGRLVERHLLDSLSVAPMFPRLPEGAVLDLGSGAGLPGVPLAIVNPDRPFELCERMAKRARFLTRVVHELDLQNVSVTAVDAADLAAQPRYGVVVARAVATVEVLWAMVADMLIDDGRLLLFLTTRTEQTDEALATPDGLNMRVHEVPVANNAQHAVLEVWRA